MEPYYEDDFATIYHGEALALLQTFAEDSVDMVLTDPPYSSGGQYRGDRTMRTSAKYSDHDRIEHLPDFTGDNRDQRSHAYWCVLWLDQCRRIAVPGAICAMFTDWRQLPTATDALQAGGWVWRGVVAWDKVNSRPQSGRYTQQAEFVVWGTNGPREIAGPTAPGVFRALPPVGDDRDHQTEKPAGVLSGLLRVLDRPGVVLDPFMGSGSTLRAAKDAGHRAVGIEIDAHFCDVAARRMAQEVLAFPA